MTVVAQAWYAREETVQNAFGGIDFQADYMLDLLHRTDYPAKGEGVVTRWMQALDDSLDAWLA